jgi:hypothetical protein
MLSFIQSGDDALSNIRKRERQLARRPAAQLERMTPKQIEAYLYQDIDLQSPLPWESPVADLERLEAKLRAVSATEPTPAPRLPRGSLRSRLAVGMTLVIIVAGALAGAFTLNSGWPGCPNPDECLSTNAIDLPSGLIGIWLVLWFASYILVPILVCVPAMTRPRLWVAAGGVAGGIAGGIAGLAIKISIMPEWYRTEWPLSGSHWIGAAFAALPMVIILYVLPLLAFCGRTSSN